MQLLRKGLSFIPIPTTSLQEMHLNILHSFDTFSRALRIACQHTKRSITPTTNSSIFETPTTTCMVYRKLKFVPQATQSNYPTPTNYSGIHELENYIFNTKDILDQKLPDICAAKTDNLPSQQRKALTKLQRTRHITTIKPADKNLGIVIMDTDDYVNQCSCLLANCHIYRPAQEYPQKTIQTSLEHVILPFKQTLEKINPQLYKYLSIVQHNNTPKFYGIPKIHKKYTRLPPMRPIIAQSGSPLAPSARLIDHILQPLAQSFEDYLRNSTS